MRCTFETFFNSGWSFEESEWDLKNRFQMINITIVLSTFGLIYGIIGNIAHETLYFIPYEVAILALNFILFLLLRKDRDYFWRIATFMTAQFTFLFLFLVYKSEPESLKHIWLFSYPIMLLYFQGSRRGIYWVSFIILMLLVAPVQNLIEVKYTLYQTTYIIVVFLIITLAIYFYQMKMNASRRIILLQQQQLSNFNAELEKQVNDKTAELQELNASLETKVQEKIDELIQKEQMLTTQSKLAVMGEMISMIAHQWRQPLSTITLQISNIKLNKMLGHEVDSETLDNTLDQISDNIIYLSETIDDFKTYFHSSKVKEEIEVHELLQRAVNFIVPRMQNVNIEFVLKKKEDICIATYVNEMIQVVLNIVNNAIDALIEMNRSDAKIEIFIKQEQEHLLIYIQDNGDGISENNIEYIFEPYFSTKGKNGTGLGLYMSQMIIQKQFDGEIRVESSSKGTTFIIDILR